MADNIGQFETSDNQGSSVAYTGTVTTTASDVPASAGDPISQVLVGARSKRLEVSFDGGTTYFPFDSKGEVLTWDVKGEITQLKVRASSGSADYRIIINFEDC